MARIFLSYAREDDAWAERIAAALEDAGHRVWWDREISAGSSFSNEIDDALSNSELIVVLWSKNSIKSDWVRDEAAIGRDSGRLLPALIGTVDPPLGFRQYQAVTLTARGRRPVEPLIKAIGRKLGPQGEPTPLRIATRALPFQPSRLAMAIIALVILVAAAGGTWWFTRSDGDAGLSIAVAASGGNAAQSQELAQSLSRDLGRFRAGPLGSLTIVEGEGPAAAKSSYRVEVGVSGSGGQLQADVALKQGRESSLLWSSLIPEPHGRMIDLRQQISAQVGDVLNCLAELGDLQRKIGRDSLSLYLRGCADGDRGEAIGIFRQLTRREPEFGPGWANLAMLSAWGVGNAVEGDRAALIAQAKAALAKAKILGPTLPETFVAQSLIRPSGGAKSLRTVELMDGAIAQNPDSPLLRGVRTEALQELGRMNEAVAESARASDLNPLSPALLDIRASALAYAGQIDAALKALAEAEKSWPGSAPIAQARFRLDLRFGDPARAEKYLRNSGTSASPTDLASNIAFLQARADPSDANIERALASYRARYAADPADVPAYLQALVMFGRIDEAYGALVNDTAVDSVSASSDVLFRSYMAPLRADPRFMTLAKRVGLVDVWQKTNIWPDFCIQPGLPWNCRSEAAKVKAVRVVSP